MPLQDQSGQKDYKTQLEQPAESVNEIPVTYIWFGPQIPQDYLISLSTLDYPINLMINPPIQQYFNRPLKHIQQADYYRLWYMYQNGGMYSDFDNRIDYSCVTKVLSSEKYKNETRVIFWWDPERNIEKRHVVPNSFIYCKDKKMTAMKNIIVGIDEENRDLQFAGMKYLAKFASKDLIQVEQLHECIIHEYDFSWVKESASKRVSVKEKGQSKVNTGNNGQEVTIEYKQQLARKRVKKVELLKNVEELKQQRERLKEQKDKWQREYQIANDKFKNKQEQLLKQYRKHYVTQSETLYIPNRQHDTKIIQNSIKTQQNNFNPPADPSTREPEHQSISSQPFKQLKQETGPYTKQQGQNQTQQFELGQFLAGALAGSLLVLLMICIAVVWYKCQHRKGKMKERYNHSHSQNQLYEDEVQEQSTREVST